MVVASRRRGGHGRDGRRFAATKRLRSSLRDDNIDDEVVMSWRSPLRGDETVAVVASRREDDMMVVASRRRGAMVVTVAASRRRDGRSFISDA